jgi:hypothetical protein
MPTGGWQGLTASDNSQAVNIAKVMKQFTDEGIEVWLRFAHEVNWYQTDGTCEHFFFSAFMKDIGSLLAS